MEMTLGCVVARHISQGSFSFCFQSDQDAIAVIHFVLDDLGCPAGEGFDSDLHLLVLPADFDLLIPLAFPGAAQQGKAAFFRFVFLGECQDLRIKHEHIASVAIEGDDPFRLADHIGGHANAGFFVKSQGIQQIPGDGQIFLAGGRRLPGQQKGVVYQFLDHGVTSKKISSLLAAQHNYHIKEESALSTGKWGNPGEICVLHKEIFVTLYNIPY